MDRTIMQSYMHKGLVNGSIVNGVYQGKLVNLYIAFLNKVDVNKFKLEKRLKM